MIKLSPEYRKPVMHVIRVNSYLEDKDRWWMLHAIGLVPMYNYENVNYQIIHRLKKRYGRV